MLRLMGLADLGKPELYMLLLISLCVSFGIGWAMNLIMRHVGFGIFGNAIVSMLGITGGLMSFTYVYRIFDLKTLPILMLFIVATIMFLLILLSWLRRILKL